eukprot:m.11449 g.11449  ORF g.11449 m.11449 type:complete len:61 (-) comp3156_c0_seq1:135-317(-)
MARLETRRIFVLNAFSLCPCACCVASEQAEGRAIRALPCPAAPLGPHSSPSFFASSAQPP